MRPNRFQINIFMNLYQFLKTLLLFHQYNLQIIGIYFDINDSLYSS